MREWLSGRALPCQGKCREFESRLPLQQKTKALALVCFLFIWICVCWWLWWNWWWWRWWSLSLRLLWLNCFWSWLFLWLRLNFKVFNSLNSLHLFCFCPFHSDASFEKSNQNCNSRKNPRQDIQTYFKKEKV